MTKRELLEALQRAGCRLTQQEQDVLWEAMDTNQDGTDLCGLRVPWRMVGSARRSWGSRHRVPRAVQKVPRGAKRGSCALREDLIAWGAKIFSPPLGVEVKS